MSNYDWYGDACAKHDSIRHSLVNRMRDNGYSIVWKPRSPGAGAGWAADHIQYLECQWCGTLVHDDRLHRKSCIEPLTEDVEPPLPLT